MSDLDETPRKKVFIQKTLWNFAPPAPSSTTTVVDEALEEVCWCVPCLDLLASAKSDKQLGLRLAYCKSSRSRDRGRHIKMWHQKNILENWQPDTHPDVERYLAQLKKGKQH